MNPHVSDSEAPSRPLSLRQTGSSPGWLRGPYGQLRILLGEGRCGHTAPSGPRNGSHGRPEAKSKAEESNGKVKCDRHRPEPRRRTGQPLSPSPSCISFNHPPKHPFCKQKNLLFPLLTAEASLGGSRPAPGEGSSSSVACHSELSRPVPAHLPSPVPCLLFRTCQALSKTVVPSVRAPSPGSTSRAVPRPRAKLSLAIVSSGARGPGRPNSFSRDCWPAEPPVMRVVYLHPCLSRTGISR